MDQLTLRASSRAEKKTGAARRLRAAGSIPGIIYGHREPKPVAVGANDFANAFKVVGESHILSLDVDGESYDVLVKDYQRDLLTGHFIHIDFYEIEAGRTLRTSIQIRLEGSAPGVREGGVLGQYLYELDIECLPKDIPDGIEVDISELDIGDSVHVAGLTIPESVRVLSNEDQVVVQVSAARAEEELLPEGEEEEGEEGEGLEEGEEDTGESED